MVRLTQVDEFAQLSVADQGIGIPEHALARLFERFYRVEQSKERYISGAGLGLYVVKEVVAHHQGTVSVESRLGEGSRFTVSLPLLQA